MEFIITRRGGIPCRETLPARLCTPEDIPALWALEQQVLAALPDPALFMPTLPEELAAQLKAGFILAVWDGEEAAAYVSMEYCRSSPAATGGTPAHRTASWTPGPIWTPSWCGRTCAGTACSRRC